MLADRYTTSNAIHQASKLDGEEQNAYLDWLFDFEYRIMGLPPPDHVFFLDMPTEAVHELLIHREGKSTDIHEKDIPYLQRCYQTASKLADRFHWERIRCTKNGSIRSIEAISNDLIGRFAALIEK